MLAAYWRAWPNIGSARPGSWQEITSEEMSHELVSSCSQDIPTIRRRPSFARR